MSDVLTALTITEIDTNKSKTLRPTLSSAAKAAKVTNLYLHSFSELPPIWYQFEFLKLHFFIVICQQRTVFFVKLLFVGVEI